MVVRMECEKGLILRHLGRMRVKELHGKIEPIDGGGERQ